MGAFLLHLSIYKFILIRSRLKMFPFFIVFLTFVLELWPLIDVGILFPLNILRTNE